MRLPEIGFPSPSSVKGAVLADLLSGLKLTHEDVWRCHGSSRAAHHVLVLRKAGWPIISTEIEAPTKDGRTARIAEYSLPPNVIAEVGDAGTRFVQLVCEARREAA